eukprot:m.25851 g.25851  ORF g.25851 m.25851 type:complete len:74 (+) comp11633_c0_seq2:798-1019(+)
MRGQLPVALPVQYPQRCGDQLQAHLGHFHRTLLRLQQLPSHQKLHLQRRTCSQSPIEQPTKASSLSDDNDDKC